MLSASEIPNTTINVFGNAFALRAIDGAIEADRPILGTSRHTSSTFKNLINVLEADSSGTIEYKGARTELSFVRTTHNPTNYFYYAAGTTVDHKIFSKAFNKSDIHEIIPQESNLGVTYSDKDDDVEVISFTKIGVENGEQAYQVRLRLKNNAYENSKKRFKITLNNGESTKTGHLGVTKLISVTWINQRVKLPAGFKPGMFKLAAGLIDPQTKEARVRFAVKEQFSDGWVDLGALEVVS